MAINFNKYAEEGNLFVKDLARSLGHPEEIGRTGILPLVTNITKGEFEDIAAQLPKELEEMIREGTHH